MGRALILVSCVVVIALALAGPASAGNGLAIRSRTVDRSLTARDDPHDTHHVPDIRTVWSEDTGSSVYVRIRAWERLRNRDIAYRVALDTRGSNLPDRLIEIPNVGVCFVYEVDPDRSVGELIGQRPWHRPDRHDVACRLPRGWFDKTTRVSFVVYSGALGESRTIDRAPDDGRYIGL